MNLPLVSSLLILPHVDTIPLQITTYTLILWLDTYLYFNILCKRTALYQYAPKLFSIKIHAYATWKGPCYLTLTFYEFLLLCRLPKNIRRVVNNAYILCNRNK